MDIIKFIKSFFITVVVVLTEEEQKDKDEEDKIKWERINQNLADFY